MGKHRLNLSDDQILYVLIAGLILFCSLSTACFLICRRKRQLNEDAELTEYEENYLAIRSIRISIKKAQKQKKGIKEIEKLNKELLRMKQRYTYEFISYLDKVVYLKEIEKGVEECPVCQEKYEDGGTYIKIPKCKHLFHFDCLQQWLNTKNQEKEQRCPLCNIQLNITELRKRKLKSGDHLEMVALN